MVAQTLVIVFDKKKNKQKTLLCAAFSHFTATDRHYCREVADVEVLIFCVYTNFTDSSKK